MSGTSRGDMFLVKVDTAANGAKEKAILPGYRPDACRVSRADAAGNAWFAISGDNGTPAGRALLFTASTGVLSLGAVGQGMTFRADGVAFAGHANAPMGGVGTWLVEFLRASDIGLAFVDMAQGTTYSARGVPSVDDLASLFTVPADELYKTELPWFHRAV